MTQYPRDEALRAELIQNAVARMRDPVWVSSAFCPYCNTLRQLWQQAYMEARYYAWRAESERG